MRQQSVMTILLVEDDAGHARLIEKNLCRAQITNDLIVLPDSQQALDYLFQENEYAAAQHSMPHVIILDLNLPGLDGYQMLSRLKANVRTQHIPVVVVSTSNDPDEIEHCYALGCHAYITKSGDYVQFIESLCRQLRALPSITGFLQPGDEA